MVVSFLSYVEVYQGGRWGWRRRRLGRRAMERPKAMSITRLAGPGACAGQAGRGWNEKEQEGTGRRPEAGTSLVD